MKSAMLAAIFLVTGGVAILFAVSPEEKAPVIRVQLPKSFPDYGEPVVPQMEQMPPQEVLLPEPSDRYLVAPRKAEKPAPRRHMHVVRRQPNFFEKLVASFINLQKHQSTKSFVNGPAQSHGAAE